MTRRTRATPLATFAFAVSISACHSGQSDQTPAAALAACDRVFDTLYVQCAQAAPPPDALARLRQRYEEVCRRGLALPGVTLTPEKLTSCANAAAADGCRLSSMTACLGPGILGGDASCAEPLQCASNSCSKPYLYDPDSGSSQMLACGSCGVVIPVGQPCGNSAQGQCAPGAQCNLSSPNPTCVLVNTGNVGTSCFGLSGGTSCKPGLYCNPFTGNCNLPQEAGAPCSAAMDCAYPLSCKGSPTQTCQNPGGTGAPCYQDSDCAGGLVCDTAKAPNQCVVPRWAASGEPCTNTVRCLVGDCPTPFFGGGGTCPVVIPDGQPCGSTNRSAATCDAFASCVNGICSLGESVACP